jgi:CHAT domain-containing protein
LYYLRSGPTASYCIGRVKVEPIATLGHACGLRWTQSGVCRLRPMLGRLGALIGVVLVSVSVASSQQPVAADVAQGKDLIAHLSTIASPDSAKDMALFSQIGLERSATILTALVTSGKADTATSEDWAKMHRALDGLIELSVGKQELFKASIYANLQESFYRYDEGDYVAALATARVALDLQQRSGVTATLYIPWNDIGKDLLHLGRIDEAAPAFYQAQKLVQDPTAPSTGDLWREIILLELSRRNSVVAHNESDAFLAAAAPSTPAEFRAEALLSASRVDIDEHRYDDAIAHIHAALSAIKTEPDPMLGAYEAIGMLGSMALEALQSMPFDQAIALCDRVDKGFAALPFSIAEFAREASNHRRRLAGEFSLVLREDSAQLERARGANDLPGEVDALLSTAADYAYLRESTQQIAVLQQGADILHSARGGSISPTVRFRLLNALGAAQLAHDDPISAGATYSEAITAIEAISSARTLAQLGDFYGDAKLGMAGVLQATGKLQDARDLLRQSLDPPPNSLGHFKRSAVLLQQAKLEQSAKQSTKEVLRLYLEAIQAIHQEEIAIAGVDKDRDLNSEVYVRLELVKYLATDARADASPKEGASSLTSASIDSTAREQLALARTASSAVGLTDAIWRVQFLQGILDQNAGDDAGAIKSYSAAADALDHIRTGLSEPEQRQAFIDNGSVQELYRRQIQLLTAGGNREQVWEFIERDKARSFLETLRGRRFATQPAGATTAATTAAARASAEELNRLEGQILAARLSLAPENVSKLRDAGNLPATVSAKLILLEGSYALARDEETLATSRATQPLALRPVTLVATQARLPVGTALIEYSILDHELAAFVVTHTSATELHWAADTVALPAQLGKLSDLLASRRSSEDELNAQLTSASTLLLGPVLRALPADTETLLIVPTQSLCLIPFQALPLPEKGSVRGFATEDTTSGGTDDLATRTLLIDRFAVAYLPSASTLQFLRPATSSASPDLFLGAIGDLSVEGWPALPGTLDETSAIQKLYPHASRVTGSAFTHEVAVKALLEHQEVHFATHGLFEEQAPLFSALITAPSPGQPSRLSLYEVMDLNLKARLVILSACETDRGQLIGGDEISSLTRTFLQAGADNVVSSLWNVSDESTALLMQSLHAHLRAGEPTALALRHAELQVRRKFPQPFFWAAFVDTGAR